MKDPKNKNDLFKEVVTFLPYFSDEIIEKIPSQVLIKINDLAADSDAEFYVDEEKDLKEQNMSESCKDFIALIYYNYIADENEKEKILKSWNENEKKYQKELENKYDLEKIIQENLGNDSDD